ncbi:hypothetical protein CEP54_011309 [Fusarium duplospermum]|uniref:Uncharacterized protein n=1 Tax=Fusarium duplospermum TaxID=1325734 RepID=A0A428PF33_9HYPO|nr:hypothetical protein CEP54_011309 [Fusarium duplospermum]
MVVFDGHEYLTEEERRLKEDRDRTKYWKKWGPYVAERQWATGMITALMEMPGATSPTTMPDRELSDGVKMVLLASATLTAGKTLDSASGMRKMTFSRNDSLASPTPRATTEKVSRKPISTSITLQL